MIEKLAKQIKRNNKKRNLNITLAAIIGFLLSSGIVYGETLNSPIDSNTTYDKDTKLEMTGKQIIATTDTSSSGITIDAKGYTLELEHETGARGDDINIFNGSTRASIAATTGDIDIEVKKLVLNSTFTSSYASYSIVASPKQGTSSTPKITLNAKEIEIYAKGADQVYGIGTEENGSVKILGNLKMNIESVGGSYGLTARGGNISLTNDYTSVTMRNIGGTANAAYGIRITSNGKIDIESKKLTLDIYSTSTQGASGIFTTASGILNINTEDIDIKTESISFDMPVTSIDAVGASKVNINNKNLLKIETISEDSARSVYTSGADTELTINSKDIIIKTDSTGTGTANRYYSYGLYAYKDGKLKITSNNITINTNANGRSACGLLSYEGGEVEITSDNTVFNTTASSGQAIGISALTGGKVTINGGLEISQTGATNYSVVSNSNGVVNLNQNNEAVDVKINGEMQAKTGGTINLNLNGKDSYFIGKSYIDTDINSKTNLGISNNAVWKNEGNSRISDLNFDNGIIDMTHETDGQKIEIDKMSGNHGKIIMDISSADTDQTNGKTDFISIKDADTEQKHYIEVGGNSIIDLLNYDFSEDILIGEASDKIKFEGSEFADISNIYDYTLKLKEEGAATTGNNWYVTGVEKKESTVTETITDDMSLHYMNAGLARMEADTLHKRLGDVRDSKEGAGV